MVGAEELIGGLTDMETQALLVAPATGETWLFGVSNGSVWPDHFGGSGSWRNRLHIAGALVRCNSTDRDDRRYSKANAGTVCCGNVLDRVLSCNVHDRFVVVDELTSRVASSSGKLAIVVALTSNAVSTIATVGTTNVVACASSLVCCPREREREILTHRIRRWSGFCLGACDHTGKGERQRVDHRRKYRKETCCKN